MNYFYFQKMKEMEGIALLLLTFYKFASSQNLFACHQPGVEGFQCSQGLSSIIYYWSVLDNRCKQLKFLGCGQGMNHFKTLAECKEQCDALARCPIGQPFNDATGFVQHCSVSQVNQCPVGFECLDTDSMGSAVNTICCPSKRLICNQPVDSGYRCLGFQLEHRYFFDPLIRQCRIFNYLGCTGNLNNFKTKSECLDYCSDGPLCERGEPLPQTGGPYLRECDQSNPCTDSHFCTNKRVKIGDLPYIALCCPKPQSICRLPLEVGRRCSQGDPAIKWRFNPNIHKCQPFRFDGCDGNENRFTTDEQCQSYCLGKCPSGTEAFLDPTSGKLQGCTLNAAALYDNCSQGYTCMTSSSGNALCCKAPPQCPGGAETYRNPTTGGAVYCKHELGMVARCPAPYTCTKATTKDYICCIRPVTCPYGFLTLKDEIAGGLLSEPRYCALNVPGNCPTGYRCMQTAIAKSLCCQAYQQCIMPYIDPDNLAAVTCSPGMTECPASTHCLFNQYDERNYCCKDVSYALCPDGSIPLIKPMKTSTVKCVPAWAQNRLKQSGTLLEAVNSCPSNFYCTSLVGGAEFGCCRRATVDEVCKVAFIEPKTESVVRCGSSSQFAPCPDGTICQKASNGNYYCCVR